jgi:hypothetical protein
MLYATLCVFGVMAAIAGLTWLYFYICEKLGI